MGGTAIGHASLPQRPNHVKLVVQLCLRKITGHTVIKAKEAGGAQGSAQDTGKLLRVLLGESSGWQ